MKNKKLLALNQLLLTSVLIVTAIFSVPAAVATSQCTTKITTESSTNTVARSFSYIIFGAVTGNWTAVYNLVLRGNTYTITTNTQCAPR